METVGSFRGSPIEDVISRGNMLSRISSVKGLACGCYRTPFVFKPGSCKTQEAALEFSLVRPGWPQTSGGPPTSVPQVLELLTHLKLIGTTDLNHKEIAKFTI